MFCVGRNIRKEVLILLDITVQPQGSEDSVSTLTLMGCPEEPKKGKFYNRGISQGLPSLVFFTVFSPEPHPGHLQVLLQKTSCQVPSGRPCVHNLGLYCKQSLTRSVSKVSSISMICWMLLVTVEMTLSMRWTTPLVAWWSAFSSRAQLTVTICQRRSKVEW